MIRKLARPMLASVYIADGADTLMNAPDHVEGTETILKRLRGFLPRKYARKIPKDPIAVTKAIGGAKVGAGSMLAIGRFPRLSATTLAVATVPTILARHAFWETQDANEKAARRSGFLTDIALLGGLAITSVDNEGRPGLKWRASHAASVANKKVQAALPTRSETEKIADNAKGWFEEASDKVHEYADTARDFIEDNKDDWIDAAQTGAAVVSSKVSDAVDYVADNKDDWLSAAQDNAEAAKKSVVKAASKAQDRADEALKDAEKQTGRRAKKAKKKAAKLQKTADKSIAKAQKKLSKKFDF